MQHEISQRTSQNEMPARVRAAVAQSAYGPSLFPNWRFHVSKTLARLTVRAPGAPISACWEWDPDMRDEDIALAIEMLVTMYLRQLIEEHGIDLTPPLA
jgi:hypothetical protein